MTHDDFHTMPAMSRRAFLAGLMALPAAAAVPGLSTAQSCADSPWATSTAEEDFLALLIEAKRAIERNPGNPGPYKFFVGGRVVFEEGYQA